MAVSYVYIKDKDGNATKMAADSFDSAMYPNNVSFDPVLAAALGLNSEEQAVQIRGEHALCSVVASECVVGSGYGVSASAAYFPRITATAGVAMSGASDNAADAPAGVGALTLLVTGVGAAFVEQYGVCTLSGVTAQPLLKYTGTSAVTATANWLGINKVEIHTAGASAKNVGSIHVSNDTFTAGLPATFQMSIGPGDGISRTATYVVPSGKSLYVKDLQYKLSDAGSIRLQYYDMSSTGSGIIKVVELDTGAAAVENGKIDLNYALVVPEKSKIEVWGYGAAGSIRVEAVINGFLKDDV